MATRKKVAFTVHPSDPVVVTITMDDGSKLLSRLSLALLEVVDTGEKVPKRDDLPLLEFRAQLLAETEVAPPESLKA